MYDGHALHTMKHIYPQTIFHNEFRDADAYERFQLNAAVV